MSGFGSFYEFCRRAPLPVCNLLSTSLRCKPKSIGIDGHKVGDIGTLIIDILVICLTIPALVFTNSRKAAVARRELQIVVSVYAAVSLCDMFTTARVFESPQDISYHGRADNYTVVKAFSAAQVGLTTVLFWTLFLFSMVSHQLMADGTGASLGMILGSSALLFAGETYIAVDTGFGRTGAFEGDYEDSKSIPLYVLYLGLPLLCAVGYVVNQVVSIVRLDVKKPYFTLLAIVVSFGSGQIIEILAGQYICRGTRRSIDGALVQTLMSAVAMAHVVYLWASTTERDWPGTGYTGRRRDDESVNISISSIHERIPGQSKSTARATTTAYQDKYHSQAGRTTPVSYKAIHIESMPGLTVESGISQLNQYREDFLNRVESEIRTLITSSQKRDLTAVVAGGYIYRGPPVNTDGWKRRFYAMTKHGWSTDEKLPTYEGEELDSWLTGKISEKIDEVHHDFLKSHSDICGKVMLERLRDYPSAMEVMVRQLAASAREAGKPITDEMCKGLVHLISAQLATSTADQLGQQIGHALLHAGGSSVIAAFTTSMAHALTSTITKLTLKAASNMTMKVAMKKGGGVLAHLVISTILTSVGATAAAGSAHGGVAAFFSLAMPVVMGGIIIAIVGWEVTHFTRNLADKIAPKVRQIMSGEFEEKNRSALGAAGKDSLVAFGKEIGIKMAMESEAIEHMEAAAKEMVRAKLLF